MQPHDQGSNIFSKHVADQVIGHQHAATRGPGAAPARFYWQHRAKTSPVKCEAGPLGYLLSLCAFFSSDENNCRWSEPMQFGEFNPVVRHGRLSPSSCLSSTLCIDEGGVVSAIMGREIIAMWMEWTNPHHRISPIAAGAAAFCGPVIQPYCFISRFHGHNHPFPQQ
jgi:hypothetical protein